MIDVDAVIAEALETNATEQQASETEASEVETSEPSTAQVVETEEDIGKKPDSELTPEQLAKREVNRQSHQNSKLAQLRRELRAERKLNEQLRSTPAKQEPQAPVMDNFDSLEEYMDARDAFRDSKNSTAQSKEQPQDDTRAYEMQDKLAREAEFARSTPEYTQLIAKNREFFGEVEKDAKLANAIIEADNAPLALYALMKEGMLDELYDLSPTRLAAEIAKAEIRGQSYLTPPKRVTNAPAPIEAAKGNGSSSTELGDKTVDQLMKHFDFRKYR